MLNTPPVKRAATCRPRRSFSTPACTTGCGADVSEPILARRSRRHHRRLSRQAPRASDDIRRVSHIIIWFPKLGGGDTVVHHLGCLPCLGSIYRVMPLSSRGQLLGELSLGPRRRALVPHQHGARRVEGAHLPRELRVHFFRIVRVIVHRSQPHRSPTCARERPQRRVRLQRWRGHDAKASSRRAAASTPTGCAASSPTTTAAAAGTTGRSRCAIARARARPPRFPTVERWRGRRRMRGGSLGRKGEQRQQHVRRREWSRRCVKRETLASYLKYNRRRKPWLDGSILRGLNIAHQPWARLPRRIPTNRVHFVVNS